MRNPFCPSFLMAVALAACATPPALVGPALRPAGGDAAVGGPAARVSAECRLLERAQEETRARGLRAWPDVLVGCPGHEALRNAMSLAQMSAATRAANAAPLPAGVARGRSEMIYRRMITRGVPEPVARDLATSVDFAAAVR